MVILLFIQLNKSGIRVHFYVDGSKNVPSRFSNYIEKILRQIN